jgi:hypothetical protein
VRANYSASYGPTLKPAAGQSGRGFRAPAFIMLVLLAALFYLPWFVNAASALRPLCVAWDLG